MKELLFYGGNIGCITYLAFIIGRQLYESRKLKQHIEEAESQYQTAKREMDMTRSENLTAVTLAYVPIYGHDIGIRVQKGVVFEDMPLILLLISLGLPDKIQDGFNRGKKISKWFYGETTNRLGNAVYDFEVNVEDYTVVGWRDLR